MRHRTGRGLSKFWPRLSRRLPSGTASSHGWRIGLGSPISPGPAPYSMARAHAASRAPKAGQGLTRRGGCMKRMIPELRPPSAAAAERLRRLRQRFQRASARWNKPKYFWRRSEGRGDLRSGEGTAHRHGLHSKPKHRDSRFAVFVLLWAAALALIGVNVLPEGYRLFSGEVWRLPENSPSAPQHRMESIAPGRFTLCSGIIQNCMRGRW
jgi:hypothetical protein